MKALSDEFSGLGFCVRHMPQLLYTSIITIMKMI